MSDITPSSATFLKRAIENNNVEVDKYALLIKISDDVNNGFESTDNFSILKRTKIKEISEEFLQHFNKYGRVFIIVNDIKISTRFDYILNQFHKKMVILDYTVSENELFIVKEDLESIETIVYETSDTSYEPEDDEKDLVNIYNDVNNISYNVNVLVLEKSSYSKRKGSEEFTFNILVADYLGNVMKYARTFSTRSNLKNFTTFDKGLILTVNSTQFHPSNKQFYFEYQNRLLEELDVISQCENDGQVNVVGIIGKVENIVTHSNENINVLTSRRIVFITNGNITLPVYIYRELAYFQFQVGALLGIRFGVVKPHLVCKNIITCNKMSYLMNVDIEEYCELFNKGLKIDYSSMVFPDLSLAPTISDVINGGKYLMHISDTPAVRVNVQKFYTIGKISFFGKIQTPNKTQKDYGPYLRITISDALVNMQHVTIFVNKLSKIMPSLTGQMNRLMNDGVDLNEYCK
uniref:Piwi domain-containing protein n=1 Tax=Strongyloides papillosus TaxID=174720 RepID=A0A0N5B910_STREA